LNDCCIQNTSGGNSGLLSGSSWYQQEAARAVNQAVGRVVLHNLVNLLQPMTFIKTNICARFAIQKTMVLFYFVMNDLWAASNTSFRTGFGQ